MLIWTLQWMMSNIMWVMVKTHLYELWDPNMAWAYANPGPQDPSIVGDEVLDDTSSPDYQDVPHPGSDQTSTPSDGNE